MTRLQFQSLFLLGTSCSMQSNGNAYGGRLGALVGLLGSFTFALAFAAAWIADREAARAEQKTEAPE